MRGLERTIVVGALSLMAGCVGGIWLAARSGWIDWNSMVTAAPLPPVMPGPPSPAKVAKIGPAAPGMVEAVAVPPQVHSSGSGVISQRAARVDLLPEPGCLWLLDPVVFEPDQTWSRRDKNTLIVTTASLDDRPGTRIVVNRIGPSSEMLPPIRVVLFDQQGRRTALETPNRGHGRNSDQVFEQTDWRAPWGDSASAEPLYFGIERVFSDADHAATAAAQSKARTDRVAILPPPRLGEPYRFSLVGDNGRPVRSEDFLGKAVVVVVTQRNDLFPLRLAKLRSDHPDNLAVVVVSFDATAEPVRKTLQQAKLDAALVMIPNNPEIRSLWTVGGAISAIPMYLTLDRDGVLRQVSREWFDLDDRVSDTMGELRAFAFPPVRPHVTDKFGPPRIPDAIPFRRPAEPMPGREWRAFEGASPEQWATLVTPVPFVGQVLVPWTRPFRWTPSGRASKIYPRSMFPSRLSSKPLDPGAAPNGAGLPGDPMARLAPRVKSRQAPVDKERSDRFRGPALQASPDL